MRIDPSDLGRRALLELPEGAKLKRRQVMDPSVFVSPDEAVALLRSGKGMSRDVGGPGGEQEASVAQGSAGHLACLQYELLRHPRCVALLRDERSDAGYSFAPNPRWHVTALFVTSHRLCRGEKILHAPCCEL